MMFTAPSVPNPEFDEEIAGRFIPVMPVPIATLPSALTVTAPACLPIPPVPK
jgi:hypothetical protein